MTKNEPQIFMHIYELSENLLMKCSYTLHSGLAAHSSQKAHKGFSFRVLLNADQKVNEILLE